MGEEKNKKITFEEALSRLEAVVRELEDGKLTLEQALELFAEGISLSRICSRHLATAEQRVAVLIEGQNGELTLKDFPSNGHA